MITNRNGSRHIRSIRLLDITSCSYNTFYPLNMILNKNNTFEFSTILYTVKVMFCQLYLTCERRANELQNIQYFKK